MTREQTCIYGDLYTNYTQKDETSLGVEVEDD